MTDPVLPTGIVMLEMRVVEEFVTWIITFRMSEVKESFEDGANVVPTSYVTLASMIKAPSVSLGYCRDISARYRQEDLNIDRHLLVKIRLYRWRTPEIQKWGLRSRWHREQPGINLLRVCGAANLVLFHKSLSLLNPRHQWNSE